MRQHYFKTAWRDVVRSPRWFTRFLVLALVSLIPVFGWIVVSGYLLGWARDIAWGAHTPLPEHVFDNSDGMLYRRGLFSAVIVAVCALVPYLIAAVGGVVSTGSATGARMLFQGMFSDGSFPVNVMFSTWGMVTALATLAAAFFAVLFGLVGSMRMSIYGRLSAGFQLGRSWAMIRRDLGGLLRIVGMALLVGLAAGVVLLVLLGVISLVVGALAVAGYRAIDFLEPAGVFIVLLAGMFVLFVSLVCIVAVKFVAMLCGALIARALGYWTCQFDVPPWRGQDDPMPFEAARE